MSRSPWAVRSLLLAGTFLCSCTVVGRDYQRPDTAVPASYYQSRSAATVQAAGTRWWQGLNDATLNQLVAAGLAQNLSLDAARERLKAAEAALRGSGRAEQVGGRDRGGNHFFAPGIAERIQQYRPRLDRRNLCV